MRYYHSSHAHENNNHTAQMPILIKPTCSFCAKSGLDIPTDHWRQNKFTGELTCPRLRETKCKCCGALGHTAKMCGVRIELEQQEKLAQRKQRQADLVSGEVWMAPAKGSTKRAPVFSWEQPPDPAKACVRLAPAGRYAALLCEEAELEEEIKELETKIAPGPVEPAPAPTVSWAAAVKRAQSIKWGSTPLEAAKRKISWDASIPHSSRTIRTTRIMTASIGTAPAKLTPEQVGEWTPAIGVPVARGYTPLGVFVCAAADMPIAYKRTVVWGEDDEDDELPNVHEMFLREMQRRSQRIGR